MSNLETWLIIILILGIIASNLVVLKYNAKFKLTQFGKNHKKKPKKTQEEVNTESTLTNKSSTNNKKDKDPSSSP
ncbi:DUF2897 family protein [uncultured Shewanella sp.]|uniref:DUF2897 family protein n=1 Tax=uncultured Shewanella sp. TaxID=173975 RepID=UPI002621D560|nr:DUF2897 family protein [uncultured Shewanella sp.]